MIARIDGDESLAVKLVDDEVVKFTFIVGGISNKEGASSETIEQFKLFNEFASDNGIGAVIWEREGYEGYSLFGNDDMRSISPKEDEVIFFAVNLLVGIIRECGG